MSDAPDAPVARETEPEEWDAEHVYDREFSPLIGRLIALAKEHDMPLHVTVQYAGGEEAGHCTTHVPGTRSGALFRGLYAASQGPPRPSFAITTRREDGTIASHEVVL